MVEWRMHIEEICVKQNNKYNQKIIKEINKKQKEMNILMIIEYIKIELDQLHPHIKLKEINLYNILNKSIQNNIKI